MRFFVAAFTLAAFALIVPLAYAAPKPALVINPSPVQACSWVDVASSGSVAGDVQLRLYSERSRSAILWSSTAQSVSGSFQLAERFRADRSWGQTNTADGAAFKLGLFFDGVEAVSRPLVILRDLRNAAPTAADAYVSTDEDVTLDGLLMGLDSDNDELTFRISVPPANGSLAWDAVTGAYTFTPDPDWSGSTSFSYSVADCYREAYATVYITVAPVNDAPRAEAINVIGAEDTDLIGQLSAIDVDGDVLTWRLVSGSAAGGVAVDLRSGTFQFSPHANWFGSTGFTYEAFDGALASQPATVTITLLPVNDAPVATSMVILSEEDVAINRNVTASDVEGDALGFRFGQPQHGTLVANEATGHFTYSPNADWNGTDSFSVTAFDGAIESLPATITIEVAAQNDPPVAFAAAFTSAENMELVGVLAAYDIDGDTLSFTLLEGTAEGSFQLATDGSFSFMPRSGWFGETMVRFVVTDGVAQSVPESVSLTVYPSSTEQLPPDPTLVAPPVDPTVVSDFYDSYSFLFKGENPVQFDADPNAFVYEAIGILRGRVVGTNREAIPGVRISIRGHSEFGYTKSRTDGVFDLAVNAGGKLLVDYQKAGYLPVQRTVDAEWRAFGMVPDVVLTPLSQTGTQIALGVPYAQTAAGDLVVDGDGARQAVIYFPAGVTAYMVKPGGTAQQLVDGTVRVSEYTVGETGLDAMPAELPPETAYTYAAEFTFDQAVAAGADTVRFSDYVMVYLDNFMAVRTGFSIPVGFYDRNIGSWTPSSDGIVIQIVGIADGLALIDVTGDGVAETESAAVMQDLRFSVDERRILAQRYPAGKSLWRVPTNHFSPGDFNPSMFRPPFPGEPPRPPEVSGPPPGGGPCEKPGNSTVLCDQRALKETLPVAASTMTLNYSSMNTPARHGAIRVWLASPSFLPAPIRYASIKAFVAGRIYEREFRRNDWGVVELPQYVDFVWDGRDAYGRVLLGKQKIETLAIYDFQETYAMLGQRYCVIIGGCTPSFSRVADETGYVQRTTDKWRNLTIIGQYRNRWRGDIGGWFPAGSGLGGWSLSEHHVYDPYGRTLYKGTGEQIQADEIDRVITTIAGGGSYLNRPQNGMRAVDAELGASPSGHSFGPVDIIAAADGSIYFCDQALMQVWRIDRQGILHHIAGKGMSGGLGDGGPATAAWLAGPHGIAMGKDGSLYIADTGNHRIRKVTSDGIIHTIAGTGTFGFSGDGGPATQAKLYWPEEIALAENGSVWITDRMNLRIRAIGVDGVITTVAGNGSWYGGTDGDSAVRMGLYFSGVDYLNPGLALGPDGSMLIGSNNLLLKVDSVGRMWRVAGKAFDSNISGDGGLALDAKLWKAPGIAAARDGSIYFSTANHQIRAIGPDQKIRSVVGKNLRFGSFTGDRGPAKLATLRDPRGIAIGPDQSLYIADSGNRRIRRVAPPMPGVQLGDLLVPDGSRVYAFDSRGRHLRTHEALTGTVLLSFGYDSTGRLTSITDRDGNKHTLEYDGSSVRIDAPYGQVTELTKDTRGYLASLRDPTGNTIFTEHDQKGLLTRYRDPNRFDHFYRYDDEGMLSEDEDPLGGVVSLDGVVKADRVDVLYRDALNRGERFITETLFDGIRRQVTSPYGASVSRYNKSDGTWTVSNPDGSTVGGAKTPDDRFGMLAPVESTTTRTPIGGLERTQTASVTSTLADIEDPFSVLVQVSVSKTNGRASTTEYQAAPNRATTNYSPMGRWRFTLLDAQARPIQTETAGLAPTLLIYDSRGRLERVWQQSGSLIRETQMTYDSSGYLRSIEDPLGRRVAFSYDLSGRVVQQTLPDGRRVGYEYDPLGNLTSVTPPGRTAHTFDFSPVNLVTGYDAPDAADGASLTQYSYNLAKQLVAVNRPDGVTVNYLYEGDAVLGTVNNPNTGRLKVIRQPRGDTTMGYDTAGRLASITAPDGGKLAYSYDGSLLLSTTWSNGAVNGSVSRTYNTRTFVENGVTKTGSDFWVASESVNGGNTVGFTYDLDGLLTSANTTINGSPINFNIYRDAQNGLITGSSIGGVSDSISYNGFAEPIGHSATCSGTAPQCGSTPFYNVSYVRDAIGRISSKTETVNGITHTYGYSYDLAGRLTGVDKNGVPSSSYTYDSNGNRLSYSGELGTFSGTYDAQDRLLSYGDFVYEYTANGELKKKTNAVTGEVTTYQFDAMGNLMHVSLPNGTNIDYVVDGQNRRVGKKVNGVLVKGWLYRDQLNIAAELDGSGNIVARFVGKYMIKGGQTFWLIRDHVGSIRRVVYVSSGVPAQEIEYDEFGNVVEDTNPGFQPFGFAGGLYDSDTELVRIGERDYDLVAGRWTAKDQIGFAGGDTNLYGYVLADPVNLKDPTGNGPVTFAICSSVVAAYELNETINSLTVDFQQQIDRLNDQIEQINARQSACPADAKNIDTMIKLDEMRKKLEKEIRDLAAIKAREENSFGFGDLIKGAAGEALCAALSFTNPY